MTNNPKELQNTIQKIIASSADDYLTDLYIPVFKEAKGVNLSDKIKLIKNTIKVYKDNHEDFESNRIYLILDDLLAIVKYDKIIHFQQTMIYKELYKMLYHFDQTFQAQSLLNDSKAYPTGFAKIQSDKKKVMTSKRHEKKNLVGNHKLMDRRESRLKYFLTTLYFHNKQLAKFYLHMFLTSDLEKVHEMYEDIEVSKIFLADLEYFLMQKTNIGAVIKSLGILLFSEMNYFLKMDSDLSEVYMKSIIETLFNETVNAFEFGRNIILRSSLGFFPTFGSSKKYHLVEDEIQFIKRKIRRELHYINKEHFDLLFDAFLKNPHIQYLQKYPVELFRQNPKYSHLPKLTF